MLLRSARRFQSSLNRPLVPNETVGAALGGDVSTKVSPTGLEGPFPNPPPSASASPGSAAPPSGWVLLEPEAPTGQLIRGRASKGPATGLPGHTRCHLHPAAAAPRDAPTPPPPPPPPTWLGARRAGSPGGSEPPGKGEYVCALQAPAAGSGATPSPGWPGAGAAAAAAQVSGWGGEAPQPRPARLAGPGAPGRSGPGQPLPPAGRQRSGPARVGEGSSWRQKDARAARDSRAPLAGPPRPRGGQSPPPHRALSSCSPRWHFGRGVRGLL